MLYIIKETFNNMEREVVVKITLDEDYWEDYFKEDLNLSDALLIEDLFFNFRRDGVKNIELVSKQ